MRAALEADMAKQQSWVEEAIASVAGTEQSLHQVRPCSAPQILACAVCLSAHAVGCLAVLSAASDAG